jgi:hypothetical protein
MSLDISRRTHEFAKHYDSVPMQQGRVQVDADWNEGLELEAESARRDRVHIIGTCG